MDYKVFLHASEEGFAVWCPVLPGCASQGETEAEALENIKDAIREYLSVAADLPDDAEVRIVSVDVKEVA